MSNRKLLAVCTGLTLAAANADVVPDAAIECTACAGWNVPQEPFRIYGNTYYVGTTELSAILIRTDDGLILLDAALPQGAALIDANIRALGLDTRDIKLILTSHAHFDHVGGVAALQRASGASVAASPSSARALESGKPVPDDPQFTIPNNGFPPVGNVRVIGNGDTLRHGGVEVTAHFTPGHTPGSTTWTWLSCESERCMHVVYADSLNAVSADEFRFTGGGATSSIVDSFRHSIRVVQDLPCDVLLSPHPGFFGMRGKLERQRAGAADAFIDPAACQAYTSSAAERLEQRLSAEAAAPAH